MRVRSIQRVASKSSSVSILKVVSRVIATAAASWSKPQMSVCVSSPVVHLHAAHEAHLLGMPTKQTARGSSGQPLEHCCYAGLPDRYGPVSKSQAQHSNPTSSGKSSTPKRPEPLGSFASQATPDCSACAAQCLAWKELCMQSCWLLHCGSTR